MALQVGSRLGHYDVTALIGEAGMGRATDTKLNRQVALKILPVASDPDRLARFQRAAQVLASLARSLMTGEVKDLLSGVGRAIRYSFTGHIIYQRDTTLIAVGFDAHRLELTGDPVPVLDL